MEGGEAGLAEALGQSEGELPPNPLVPKARFDSDGEEGGMVAQASHVPLGSRHGGLLDQAPWMSEEFRYKADSLAWIHVAEEIPAELLTVEGP